MKKTLFKAFGVLALAVTMVLASCSTDASNISSQIDTVLTLAKPEVKVTAYPGMNYVSWKPVANANGFKVFIYEDDHFVKTVSLSGVTALNYKDTDIKNGAKYGYIVEAESKSSTGRAVVTENAKSAEVTVTAIVPDYNVLSLDLNKHEKGINKKGDEKFLIAADNIHVARDGFDKFSVSFPSKAYLCYNVSYSIDNEKATVDKFAGSIGGTFRDNASNNKILYTNSTPTLVSGEYKIAVKASAENSHFGTSDWVISNETISVEQLIGSFDNAYAVTAAYKDIGKTIRVVFPKFVLASGVTADASYYKVYRSTQEAPHNYTLVSGTVKATNSSNANFYVDDPITDNTIGYYYTVAVTDGNGKFASTSKTSSLVDPYTYGTQTATTVSGTPSVQDTDAVKNDITWTITLPNTDVTLKGIYTLERPANESYNSGTYQVVAADFDTSDAKNLLATAKSTVNTTGKIYTVYTKDHTVGTKVYMLVVTEQVDKAIAEVISSAVEIKAPEASADNLSLTVKKYDNTITGATPAGTVAKKDDVIINVVDGIDPDTDSIDNYTYKLYRAAVKEVAPVNPGDPTTYTWEFDAADWAEITGLTMKPLIGDNVADGSYVGIVEQTDLADGTYAYKVVKSNATSSVTKIDYVIINAAKKTISFKPGDDGIDAYFANPANAESNVVIEFYKTETGSPTPMNLDSDPAYYNMGTGNLASYIVSHNPIKEEEGVTYSLYRAVLAASVVSSTPIDVNYKLEFKKVMDANGTVAKSFGKSENKAGYSDWYWDTSVDPAVADKEEVQYTNKITYTLTDTSLSTGNSYIYLIVASKAGADIETAIAFVQGYN